LTGLGALMGATSMSSLYAKPPFVQKMNLGGDRTLSIDPRYYRWHVDPGVEWLEVNTGYASLDWSIPLSQTALVLVDVWQRHYIKEPEERAEQIIADNLIPLITACRRAGITIIHAPSLPVAKRHPNWVDLIKEEDHAPRDSWPPAEFRS